MAVADVDDSEEGKIVDEAVDEEVEGCNCLEGIGRELGEEGMAVRCRGQDTYLENEAMVIL